MPMAESVTCATYGPGDRRTGHARYGNLSPASPSRIRMSRSSNDSGLRIPSTWALTLCPVSSCLESAGSRYARWRVHEPKTATVDSKLPPRLRRPAPVGPGGVGR